MKHTVAGVAILLAAGGCLAQNTAVNTSLLSAQLGFIKTDIEKGDYQAGMRDSADFEKTVGVAAAAGSDVGSLGRRDPLDVIEEIRAKLDAGDIDGVKALARSLRPAVMHDQAAELRPPRASLAELEAQAGNDPMKHPGLLGMMSDAAFAEGDVVKAERYARELLAHSDSDQRGLRGQAVYYGNMTLGKIALKSGDVTLAVEYMLQAGKTEGAPELDSFGPGMALARDLLAKGEKDAVLTYLTECRSFWRMEKGKLAEWTANIEAGVKPVFGANGGY